MGVQLAGAILAGGRSSRMGRDKAVVAVGGVAMAGRVADALRSVDCEPVVAVGGDAGALASLGLETVADRWPGEGPLGGIVTALAHTAGAHPGRPTLVVACDLPHLDPEALRVLLTAAADLDRAAPCDAVIARTDRLEPLCALWMPSSRAALETAMVGGERAVHRAVESLHVIVVDVPADALFNVNTPTDLGRTQR